MCNDYCIYRTGILSERHCIQVMATSNAVDNMEASNTENRSAPGSARKPRKGPKLLAPIVQDPIPQVDKYVAPLCSFYRSYRIFLQMF